MTVFSFKSIKHIHYVIFAKYLFLLLGKIALMHLGPKRCCLRILIMRSTIKFDILSLANFFGFRDLSFSPSSPRSLHL